jgi:hypothetical protein
MNIRHHLEAAESIFFYASLTLAVSLAIAIMAGAILRVLPRSRIDDPPTTEYGAWMFNDGAPPGPLEGARR